MKTLALCLTVGLALVCGTAMAGITVKNTKGQSMEVEVLAYTQSSGNVRIKRLPDGAIFNLKIDLFDAESQELIIVSAPRAKPKLDIKVSAGARRADVGASGYMERQRITATVEVKNSSRDVDLEETKFTIILVGRNTRRYVNRNYDGAKILSKQSVNQAIPAGKSLKFECEPVMTEYDEDKDDSNIGGWDYDGYLLILQDREGEVFDAQSSIGPVQTLLLKRPEALKKAAEYQPEMELERNLMPPKGGVTRIQK